MFDPEIAEVFVPTQAKVKSAVAFDSGEKIAYAKSKDKEKPGVTLTLPARPDSIADYIITLHAPNPRNNSNDSTRSVLRRYPSVRAAIAGGAQRIELCSALEVGGLTPSAGLIKEARILTCRKVKLHILIRPRPGDYIYTRDEIEVMLTDVDFARKLECDGVVIGALTPEGDVDTDVVGCPQQPQVICR